MEITNPHKAKPNNNPSSGRFGLVFLPFCFSTMAAMFPFPFVASQKVFYCFSTVMMNFCLCCRILLATNFRNPITLFTPIHIATARIDCTYFILLDLMRGDCHLCFVLVACLPAVVFMAQIH